MVRTIAAVQARSSSRRLPRKALLPLGGIPIVLRMARSLGLASRVDGVVLATSDDPSDDGLAALATAAGVPVSRGPVDDIVARMWTAATSQKADVLVRLWGDSPLIVPELIDRAVATLIEVDAGYLTTGLPNDDPFPIGVGLEVYSMATLERLRDAAADPFYREFPFEWVAAKTSGVRIHRLSAPRDDSDIALTVDYESDYERVAAVFDALHVEGKPLGYDELIAYCRLHPEVGQSAPDLARNPDYFEKKAQRT